MITIIWLQLVSDKSMKFDSLLIIRIKFPFYIILKL